MSKCTLTLSLIVLALYAFPGQLLSQPEVEWQRSYGGADEERFYDVAYTTDGGFILVGSETSFGHPDPNTWVVKTDRDGDTEWTLEYSFERPGSHTKVIQTEDGGYLFATRLGKMMKINDDREIIWSGDFQLYPLMSMLQTTDGGYSITGMVSPDDFCLVRIDEKGEEVWRCQFGGDERDLCISHIQTNDGGFLLVGETESFNAMQIDALMVKIDAEGEVEW